MWPGRPFFMRTGVIQASWAPAANRASTAWARTSPVTSSRLVSSNMTGCPGLREAVRDWPTTTCVQLGSPSMSWLPAPKPVASMRMGGSGPKLDAIAATMAAPVGVVSSTPTSRPHVGIPCSNRTTAGEGLGRNPCADRMVPMPVATGEALTSSTPRISRAAAVPTTSITVSWDPTSWKCTWSGGRRWSFPSTSARAANVSRARRVTRAGRRASSTRPTMWAWVRTTTSSVVSTTARVAAMPARRTGSARSPQPPRGRRRNMVSNSEKSAPASRRLPSAMSPAMPAKQWNHATVDGIWSPESERPEPNSAIPTPDPGLTAACGRRRRRHRSRCRSRPR